MSLYNVTVVEMKVTDFRVISQVNSFSVISDNVLGPRIVRGTIIYQLLHPLKGKKEKSKFTWQSRGLNILRLSFDHGMAQWIRKKHQKLSDAKYTYITAKSKDYMYKY